MRKRLIIMLMPLMPAMPTFAHEGHHAYPESAFDSALLGFSGLKEVFNLHPVFVHFPIALIPCALLLYFLGVVLRKPSLNVAGRASLYLALAGAVVAVGTGLIAQESFPHNQVIHHMMQTHRTLGLALAAVLLVLTVWSFWQTDHRPNGAWAFLGLLAFGAYLVLQNADIGGRMVYVQGASVKPAVGVIASHEENPEVHDHF